MKCKQEANNVLKNSIQSMEKELIAVGRKADSYRQNHGRDNMELKKKIVELENIVSIIYISKINKANVNIVISVFRSKRKKK